MNQSSLFETKPAPSLQAALLHPYARYGLAVALYRAKLKVDKLTEAELRNALIEAIEVGLGDFRMRTDDDPASTRSLVFHQIPQEVLQRDATLVQSSGLAARGIYINPTVVTTDGNAKDTFKNAVAVVDALRGGKPLDGSLDLSRSFAPTTAKINNGTSSQSPPKGALLEAACALITTLTRLKPGAWSGRNTTIIPDLIDPVGEPVLAKLRDFIELFEAMSVSELEGNLMEVQLPPVKKVADTPGQTDKPKKSAKVIAAAKSDKSEYRRPRLHNGNYPFAPRDTGAFGAVGLLGAIGRWGRTARKTAWAERVLESIAGNPLYIISYDGVSVVRFGHHVVRLSLEGKLSEMIDALWRDTQLYANLDSPYPRRDTPAYQLFYLQTSRFLQTFSAPAFADFLATRAEYPAQLKPLFEEYFMGEKSQKIPADVVQSAGVLGQWLNRTAYFVADGEVDAAIEPKDRANRVRKTKAKILVEFESAAMSAKSSTDMLSRISIRCGRLLNDDAPAGAKRFMDAVASEEIGQVPATQLLIAYMRLRAPGRQIDESANADAPTDSTATDGDDGIEETAGSLTFTD